MVPSPSVRYVLHVFVKTEPRPRVLDYGDDIETATLAYREFTSHPLVDSVEVGTFGDGESPLARLLDSALSVVTSRLYRVSRNLAQVGGNHRPVESVAFRLSTLFDKLAELPESVLDARATRASRRFYGRMRYM